MPEDFYAAQVLEKPHGNVIMLTALFAKPAHVGYTNGEYSGTK